MKDYKFPFNIKLTLKKNALYHDVWNKELQSLCWRFMCVAITEKTCDVWCHGTHQTGSTLFCFFYDSAGYCLVQLGKFQSGDMHFKKQIEKEL